jgi:hypothetical protein
MEKRNRTGVHRTFTENSHETTYSVEFPDHSAICLSLEHVEKHDYHKASLPNGQESYWEVFIGYTPEQNQEYKSIFMRVYEDGESPVYGDLESIRVDPKVVETLKRHLISIEVNSRPILARCLEEIVQKGAFIIPETKKDVKKTVGKQS